MILVDSSVWIDHLRKELPRLADLLLSEHVCTHAFVIGEVALGSIENRNAFITEISRLPHVKCANDFEVMALIERQHLFGLGLGLVDCHLLASALMSGAELWSRDKRLALVADRLGVAFQAG